MFFSEMKNNDPLRRKTLPGSKTCGLELQYGTKIETRFIELRADMFSCRNNPAVRIDVKLTDPLQHLFSKIPALNEMPHISTLTQAREQVIEKVQFELANVPEYHRKSFHRLNELTEPITVDMKTIRPSLRNRFTDSSTWKKTIVAGVTSHFISLVLQLPFGYLTNKYRRQNNMLKILAGGTIIQPRPVVVISDMQFNFLKLKGTDFFEKNYVLNYVQHNTNNKILCNLCVSRFFSKINPELISANYRN